MPAGVLSLILCYSFTQTHPEVNPLNLDKRLNQVLLLLFECTNEGIVTPAQQSRRGDILRYHLHPWGEKALL